MQYCSRTFIISSRTSFSRNKCEQEIKFASPTSFIIYRIEPGFRRMPIIRAREFLIQHLIQQFSI